MEGRDSAGLGLEVRDPADRAGRRRINLPRKQTGGGEGVELDSCLIPNPPPRLFGYSSGTGDSSNDKMEPQVTITGVGLEDTDQVAADGGDFEAMVRVYRLKIFRFVLASLRDDDAAGSVTQDCFLKAFRAWPAYRRECSLDTWLMRIAVNLVRDYARNRRFQFWKRTRRNSDEMAASSNRIAGTGQSAESQMLLNEQVASVWRAAGALPERQRTVFLLRFVEDLELLEIASITGMKEGTVKAHLFSAVRNVRKQMGVTI